MSASYSGGFQYDDLLTEAWERIGKSPAILTGDVTVSARRSIALLLVDWTNRGVPLWQIETFNLVLVAGAPSYALPAYIADVLDCYIVVDSAPDRVLGRIGREAYAALADKAVTAMPAQIMVNRQVPAIWLSFYPVPDQAYTVVVNVLRQPQDCASLVQAPDAPYLWSEALASGLAARVAEKYAPERLGEKRELAQEAWRNAYGEERERVPLSILPDLGMFR